MFGQMPESAQLRGFPQGRLVSKSVSDKMFSKLRGAMNGGCGMVVFMDTISMGWLSAFEPASKGRFMIEVKTELSRPQRLRTFNATAQA
jgi:hypothetical protein